MANIVLINASGIGSRFGCKIPKQFFNIGGTPILYYCLNKFQTSDLVDEIYIIAQQEYFKMIEDICKKFNINKFRQCINGGNSANESRYNGLRNIKMSGD